MLFTNRQRQALVANCEARSQSSDVDLDFKPVVKLFAPWGSATWLITEMDEDGETAFGLCDLGFGEPELGYVSIRELRGIRGPFGLSIERCQSFKADKTISEYAAEARRHGRILA